MRARLLLPLAALLLAGCTSLFMLPMRQQVLDPGRLGLQHEELRVASADGTSLHGWHLQAAAPRALACYFHGNAENISTHVLNVAWLPARGIDVVLVDYRGYGASAGKASFPEVLEDVAAALDECVLRARARGIPVVAIGQSLGAALLADVAAREEFRGVLAAIVLDSAFSDYRRVAREALQSGWLTWLFAWPLSFTVTGSHDPVDAVPRLAPVPLLLLHSRDDAVVGFAHGEALFAAARATACFLPVKGPHIAAFRHESVQPYVLAFLDAALAGGTAQPAWPEPAKVSCRY